MTLSRADAVNREIIQRRILAYIADALLIVEAILAFRDGSKRSIGRHIAVSTAISGLIAAPYHAFLEGATGQTLGKKLFRITVIMDSGESCTYYAAAIRTVFRVIDWLPVAYLVGLTSMSVTKRRQRLGDIAADTVVVYEDGPLTVLGGSAAQGEDTPCT